VSYRKAAASDVELGPGPHPAASPFDRCIGAALGVDAFGIYQVELPPGAATVSHDHMADRAEDVYAATSGAGVVVVDGVEVPIAVGEFVAVSCDSTRYVRAGEDGLVFIAVCAAGR
jgi:uncharacterized cupin superfamily protein